jgi:hypothetical protein
VTVPPASWAASRRPDEIASSTCTSAPSDAQTELQDTLRHSPVVLEQQAQRAQHFQLRIADWITRFAGSMNFVYLHIALFTVWMLFIESKPWPPLSGTTGPADLEVLFPAHPHEGEPAGDGGEVGGEGALDEYGGCCVGLGDAAGGQRQDEAGFGDSHAVARGGRGG